MYQGTGCTGQNTDSCYLTRGDYPENKKERGGMSFIPLLFIDQIS